MQALCKVRPFLLLFLLSSYWERSA